MNSNKILIYLLRYINKNKTNNIVLSGGKSLKNFDVFFLKYLNKKKIKVNIFLSDERCLSLSNKNLNQNLFKKEPFFLPILKRDKSFIKCASLYEKKITKSPNFILLSVGNDGHIASIFENSKALKSKKKIIFLDKKYYGFKRITLTLEYLKDKRVFLFCRNLLRFKTFIKCLKNKNHIINKLYNLNNNVELILKDKIIKKEIYKKIL